jgi:trafficking protein particle complex subunit 9
MASTSGVSIEVQPLTVTIAANSFHVARVMATALETGMLVIRGCIVQTQGGAPREFLLPLTSEADDAAKEKQRIAWLGQSEKIKESGLNARPWLRSKRISIVKSKMPKQKETSFVQCKVVVQQPLMRIRRTSLTHGAIMLYDGET